MSSPPQWILACPGDDPSAKEFPLRLRVLRAQVGTPTDRARSRRRGLGKRGQLRGRDRDRHPACKLVHNMVGHSVRQAVAEALTLGVKAGVDAEAIWEGLRRGALGRMHYLHEGMPKTVFRGAYDPPMFSLALARKDIGLATELAREFDVPLSMTNLAEQIAIEAMNRLP